MQLVPGKKRLEKGTRVAVCDEKKKILSVHWNTAALGRRGPGEDIGREIGECKKAREGTWVTKRLQVLKS